MFCTVWSAVPAGLTEDRLQRGNGKNGKNGKNGTDRTDGTYRPAIERELGDRVIDCWAAAQLWVEAADLPEQMGEEALDQVIQLAVLEIEHLPL